MNVTQSLPKIKKKATFFEKPKSSMKSRNLLKMDGIYKTAEIEKAKTFIPYQKERDQFEGQEKIRLQSITMKEMATIFEDKPKMELRRNTVEDYKHFQKNLKTINLQKRKIFKPKMIQSQSITMNNINMRKSLI
jgi:hypothetical protein